MSIRGKDFRCELDPDRYEELRMMAEAENKTIQVLGAEIIEEAIAGKFYTFSVKAERVRRSGIFRNGSGTSRNVADALRQKAEREYE